MALIDKLKPSYEITVDCENCGKKCTLRVKKGTSVIEAIRNKDIRCDNCKCLISPREYSTRWLK